MVFLVLEVDLCNRSLLRGSVLGPILLLILITDIDSSLASRTSASAVDTKPCKKYN